MLGMVTRSEVRPALGGDSAVLATAMVPTLRSRQAETDLQGRAPSTTHQELEEAGLFPLTLPRAHSDPAVAVE